MIDKICNQNYMEQGPNGKLFDPNGQDPRRYQPSLHNESANNDP